MLQLPIAETNYLIDDLKYQQSKYKVQQIGLTKNISASKIETFFNLIHSNKIYKKRNFQKIEMQKQTMFQSFMKKKQFISKMITQTKSMTTKQHFTHFEAVSEPIYIKAQSNAIYLTHLNTEFKDHLREFVHEQQSYNHTTFQLAKITQSLETEKDQLQNEYRHKRNQLNETELDKQILTDKNNFHLDKILSLQEQNKTLQLMGQQHQKTATQLQQQIEYQTCMLSQIQSRNTQIISTLQVKTVQIQQATFKMQHTQKTIRHKESSIKKINQDINSIYYTLEAQDQSLTQFCTSIEEGLNVQNNRINDIQFVKDRLAHVAGETQLAKNHLAKAEETQLTLLNYQEDLQFDLKRVSKQLQIENQGIDQQYWKIQQEKKRLQQNHLMLSDLQQYLQDLIHKNQCLQQSLEEQIIQDHTIKRIVDSKCQQPVGKKTKILLQQYQEKQLADTSSSWKDPSSWKKSSSQKESSSWKENTKQHQQIPRNVSLMMISPKEKRQLVQRQVNKIARRGPQQMQFVFEKFATSAKQQHHHQQNEYERQEQINKWQSNHYMNTTGFTYIDKLAKLQTQV